jgi:predicted nucleotidyltransferase
VTLLQTTLTPNTLDCGADRAVIDAVMTKLLANKIAAAATALKSYGATEVYIFGSSAAGTADEHSDVDLAVRGIPPEQFFRAMGAARRALDCPLDLVDLDEDEPFAQHLMHAGRLKRVA